MPVSSSPPFNAAFFKAASAHLADIHDICEANKGKLLFLTVFGANLYGTATIESDLDIRGIYLPADPQSQTHSIHITTNTTGERNTPMDTDIDLISLQRWLRDLQEGHIAALDLLFAPSNRHCTLYDDTTLQPVFNNPLRYLNLQTDACARYAIKQAKKYGCKGSRAGTLYAIYRWLKQMSHAPNAPLLDYADAIENHCGVPTLCRRDYPGRKASAPEPFSRDTTHDNASGHEAFSTNPSDWNFFVPNLPGRDSPGHDPSGRSSSGSNLSGRDSFGRNLSGRNSCVQASPSTEDFLFVCGKWHQTSIPMTLFSERIHKEITPLLPAIENARQNRDVDYKALSHAVRAFLQMQEILTTGSLQFPLGFADRVQSIKNGQLSWISLEPVLEHLREETFRMQQKSLFTSEYLPEMAQSFVNSVYDKATRKEKEEGE